MATRLTLDDGTTERLSAVHRAAADVLEEAAARAPSGIDGGIAADLLAAIATAVVDDVDLLHRLHHCTADAVALAGRDLAAADDEVAGAWRAGIGGLS